MKISLQFLDQMQGVTDWNNAKGFLRQQFEDLASQIIQGWNAEHNTDGTHRKATVTTDVISSGSVSALGTGTFSGQHRCFAKASAHTINNGAEDILSFAAPATDGSKDFPDTGWNVGSIFDSADPTHFTARVAGLYLINWSIQLASQPTSGYTFITTNLGPSDLAQEGFATNATSAGHLVLPMVIGQNINLAASQTSGGNIALQTSFMRSWLQMTKIA